MMLSASARGGDGRQLWFASWDIGVGFGVRWDMARTVLLEHRLPSGERHFDWLIERPLEPDALLVSFRVGVRVDCVGETATGREPLEAVRMKDHRRLYLEYEGELTGGRGDVSRVGEGEVLRFEERGERVRVEVRWRGGGAAAWEIRRVDGELWRAESVGA